MARQRINVTSTIETLIALHVFAYNVPKATVRQAPSVHRDNLSEIRKAKMNIEKRNQIDLSPENIASLRSIIARDIAKIQDALSDSSQNPTIHQQLEPIVKQNQKILQSLDTIEHEFTANAIDTIRSRGQKYAAIVQYVLRNHPQLESTLTSKSRGTTSSVNQDDSDATARLTGDLGTLSARNSVEEFGVNLSIMNKASLLPEDNLLHNPPTQDAEQSRPFLGSVDSIRSSATNYPAKVADKAGHGGIVAASLSSLHAPGASANNRLQDLINSDVTLFNLATLANAEPNPNEWSSIEQSPVYFIHGHKARDSSIAIKADSYQAFSPGSKPPLPSIYTPQGELIDPCPHHSRQILYELAKRYKAQAEELAAKAGSKLQPGVADARMATLAEENSALKVSLHSALNELSEIKQKLMHQVQGSLSQEGSLTTENISLKETIARKNSELIKQGQKLKETRNTADDLQKTKQHLTQLTDVLLEERKLLQDEILSLKPGGKSANSTKEIESMCKHVAALEKQLHSEVKVINVDLSEQLSAKLKDTILIYEQMLTKTKQRAVGKPRTPDQRNQSATTSMQAFSPFGNLGTTNTGPNSPYNPSFTEGGAQRHQISTLTHSLAYDSHHEDAEQLRSSSRPGSARSRQSIRSTSSRASSGRRSVARGASSGSRGISPEVLTYEVVKVLTELGPRAPSLQRIGPREWIVEKNGAVISVNLGHTGTVVVESEGGVPLVQFLKRLQDPPTRTTTPRRMKSPGKMAKDDDQSIGRRSPALDTSGLAMFSAARRMMTHQVK